MRSIRRLRKKRLKTSAVNERVAHSVVFTNAGSNDRMRGFCIIAFNIKKINSHTVGECMRCFYYKKMLGTGKRLLTFDCLIPVLTVKAAAQRLPLILYRPVFCNHSTDPCGIVHPLGCVPKDSCSEIPLICFWLYVSATNNIPAINRYTHLYCNF